MPSGIQTSDLVDQLKQLKSPLVDLVVMWSLVESHPKEIGRSLGSILINEIFPRLEREDTPVDEAEFYHPGLSELSSICAVGLYYQILSKRHIKQIIDDTQFWYHEGKSRDSKYACWNIFAYLQETKLLDETVGDELLAVVLEVMSTNQKAVNELKNGKDKAIGALVGAIMKKQKADPSAIQALIKQEIAKLA